MMSKPPLQPGLSRGLLILAPPLVIAFGCLGFAFAREFDVWTVVLALIALPCLVAVGFILRGIFDLLALRYELDEAGVTIRRLGEARELELDSILEMSAAPALGAVRVPGLSWTGYKIGIGRVPRQGRARFYITSERPEHALLVRLTTGLWVISPADAKEFRATWARLAGRPDAASVETVERSADAPAPIARQAVGLEPRPLQIDYPPGLRPRRPIGADDANNGASAWEAARPTATILPLQRRPAPTNVATAASSVEDDDARETATDDDLVEISAAVAVESVAEPTPARRGLPTAYRSDTVAEMTQSAASVEAMRAFDRRFWLANVGLAVGALVLNLGLWLIVLIRLPIIGDQGPFFRELSFLSPEGMFNPYALFLAPVIALLCLLVNAGIAWGWRFREPLAPPMLLGGALFIQVLILYATLKMVV